jgi:hypothetical protein
MPHKSGKTATGLQGQNMWSSICFARLLSVNIGTKDIDHYDMLFIDVNSQNILLYLVLMGQDLLIFNHSNNTQIDNENVSNTMHNV